MMQENQLSEIAEELMKGNEEAFVRFCNLKSRDILYFSLKLLDNIQDAEDLTQEVLVYVHDHINELKHPEAFHVWLYQIIRGKNLNMMRKKKRISKVVEKSIKYSDPMRELDFLPDDFENDDEKKKVIIKVVDHLSVNKKMAMIMFYYEGMKYEDIARIMEIPVKTVESFLVSSRKLLHQRLSNRHAINLKADALLLSAAILSDSLSVDSLQIIPDQSIQNVLSGTFEEIGLSGGGLQPGQQTARRQGINKNVTIGLSVGAIVAAAAIAGILLREQPADQKLLAASGNQVAVSAESRVLPQPEEAEIRTLEDMIGIEDAELLREFAAMDQIDPGQIEEFMARIGFRPDESIWDVGREVEHQMYSHTKQDKRLTIILRSEMTAGKTMLAFQFMSIETELPETFYIGLTYTEWREERRAE